MGVAMAAIERRIEQLLDREEIHDVIKRLARGTDRLDAEMMASCYHPDGFDDHNSFRGSGQEFAAWVLEVLVHFQATMHFIGAPAIRIDHRRGGRGPVVRLPGGLHRGPTGPGGHCLLRRVRSPRHRVSRQCDRFNGGFFNGGLSVPSS
jgi:SnoaL-like domain